MRTKQLFTLLSFLFLFAACKQKTMISDSKEPENLLVRFSDPVAFAFEIWNDSQTVDLGIEVNYFEDKVTLEKSAEKLKSLPLYCMVMGDDSRLIIDRKFELGIWDKKANVWAGEKTEKSGERKVTVQAVTALKVIKRRYNFKLYANTKTEENIAGISKVTFKLKMDK